MEINVPGSSYHVCAKTEFFHPPIWNRKRPVHCLCSGRFCAAKRAVSQRFPKLTEKSLKQGSSQDIGENVTLELSLELYHFLQCADSIRTNNKLIMRGGIISKRQPSL